MGEKTVVLLPTLNEEKGIGQTIDDVKEYVPDCQILVIDSYSQNGTRHIAEEKGAIVIDAPRGGKGIAVRSVLSQVLQNYSGKWYVMIDGDYTYPAKHIPSIVAELEEGADVVVGYRATKEVGSMTAVNKIGNWGLSKLASLLYGTQIKDVCTGMWGFRRKALKKFNLTSDGFTLEADLFSNAVKTKCKIRQILIEYRARPAKSKAKLKVSDGFKIGWFLIKKRLSHA